MPHTFHYLSRLRPLGFSGYAIEVIEASGARWWHSSASFEWLTRYAEDHADGNSIHHHPLAADPTGSSAVPALMNEAASLEGFASSVSIPILAPDLRGCVKFFSLEKNADLEHQQRLEVMVRLNAIAYDMFDIMVLTKPQVPMLAPRELECLEWAAVGKSNWEIGVILNIAESTVKETLQRAGAKLGTTNRTHMTTRAMALRLIDPITL